MKTPRKTSWLSEVMADAARMLSILLSLLGFLLALQAMLRATGLIQTSH